MKILDEVVRRIEETQQSKRIKLAFNLDGRSAEMFLEAYHSTVKEESVSQGQFAARILMLALEREMGTRLRRKRSQANNSIG
ncbi:MAG: hypothetical protein NTNFB02_35090 [Nitrospira sp.]